MEATRRRGDERMGLGSESKKKQVKTRKQQRHHGKDMFAMMNKMLANKPSTDESASIDIKTVEKDQKAAQRELLQLQSKIGAAQDELSRAMESVQRNKGSHLEEQFKDQVKSVGQKVQRLKTQASTLQNNIKRAKDREKMTLF